LRVEGQAAGAACQLAPSPHRGWDEGALGV